MNAAEDAAHGEWLRQTPGAYEWWYYDARSDCGQWAFSAIWFLGNPFSPYYRLAAQKRAADPLEHNALFFALYRDGHLHAYHFSRFPRTEVEIPPLLPGCLRLGPNLLTLDPRGRSVLRISDENANGRRLTASLAFDSPPLQFQETEEAGAGHSDFWLPAAPSCRVTGNISLTAPQNGVAVEKIAFTGHGYHDHNWGRLPFDTHLKEWYWARAEMENDRAVVLYHVRSQGAAKSVSHLLLFEAGRLILHDQNARVRLGRRTVNGFGTVYATRLSAESGDVSVQFDLGTRLDSAPFYLRVFCNASIITNGKTEAGQGIGEYFRPQMLASPLVASATKARIAVR